MSKIEELLNNKTFISVVSLIVAIVMLASFIAALTKFGEKSVDNVSSESSLEVESSVPSEDINVLEPEVSADDNSLLSQLATEKKQYNNSDVVNGSLAVIKNNSTSFPVIDNNKMSNIYATKTEGVYGLSGNGLYLNSEAMGYMDSFIVAFYEEVPNNGLIIDRAYKEPKDVSGENGSVDLTSGYSVEFSIFDSSYGFSDKEFKFLNEQSYRYGVIQRYPEGKKNYTGFEANDRIYRYVGVAHSWYMNYYKCCLEEYIDKLKTETVLEFKTGIDNANYIVYYVPLANESTVTDVPVPTGEGYSYSVSGDGDSGFIVTVKLP